MPAPTALSSGVAVRIGAMCPKDRESWRKTVRMVFRSLAKAVLVRGTGPSRAHLPAADTPPGPRGRPPSHRDRHGPAPLSTGAPVMTSTRP